jgi:hypothetical protein
VPGRLVLGVEPADASVTVDDAPAERDATGSIVLQPGSSHRVGISAPNRRRQEIDVTVGPGEEVRREVALVQVGEVNVASTPLADLEIDGRAAGKTPASLRDVDLGEHLLRLTADGHEPATRKIRLTEDTPNREVVVTLDPVRGSTVATKVAPLPASRPETKRPTGKARSEDTKTSGRTGSGAETGWGQLVVSTQPWGRVFVDGRDTGRNTPILPSNPLKLAAGRHQLTVMTNSGQRYTFPVTVAAGEVRRFIRRLDEE